MGKKSTKENKSIYQESREALEWSRAKACEELKCISESKLVRIENGECPQPSEFLIMADTYKNPSLCN